jgi:hypothetical protein
VTWVQADLLQVKAGLLQVIWLGQVQMDQWDLLQVNQVDQDQMDQWDLLQAIWLVDQDQTDQWDLPQVNLADQIHYLVKVDQPVDLLQENQVDLLRVIQWDLLQAWIWTAMECLHLLQMEWVICIHTWTMREHIKVQKDLLQEILGQCQVTCRQICLHLLTIQMMVVR